MSLSNVAASSATLAQQKAVLPNPFDVSDSEMLDKVYLTHLHGDDKCDKDILFNLVSNVVTRSTQIFETRVLQSSQSQIQFAESKVDVTSFKPEFLTLKLISCQMITTPTGEEYVHQTAMWVLQYLRTFSWEAKTLITLAAFSLEYGNFFLLYQQIPTSDQVGNSLKQLNQVQTRKLPSDFINLVTLVLQVLQNIKQWTTLSSEGYDSEDVPSLSEAFQVIPLVVYWTIASIVASIGNIVGVSDYKLSDFTGKLSPFVNNLKEHLNNCKMQIEEINDYIKNKKAFANPKDIVDLLKLLIPRNGSLNPQVYDGATKIKTDIEVFRQKYVLLLISSLNNIEHEISLLNLIYEKLQENSKEITQEGFKKEDFKILWVPIVDTWNDVVKAQFKTLKNGIKWYTVEYFSELPSIRLIKENLNYEGRPIIPVFKPQGTIMNEDARDLIFQWGIDAFPFRKSDGELLTQKWRWFWDVTKKVNLGIQIKRDKYIFIYGGNDKKWIQDFTLALEKIKSHDTIKRENAIIEHYQLGKDVVPRFWIEIETKKLKKHQKTLDSEIQTIVKGLLYLKQDPKGWAILTKGSNIKILGYGEPMYQTVADFEIWKNKVFQKECFDIAFKEYYDTKLKDFSAHQPCATINVDNYASNVIANITCPSPTCGRVMEVSSVNYKCCHVDGSNIGKI